MTIFGTITLDDACERVLNAERGNPELEGRPITTGQTADLGRSGWLVEVVMQAYADGNEAAALLDPTFVLVNKTSGEQHLIDWQRAERLLRKRRR